jgi:hypothetical protein
MINRQVEYNIVSRAVEGAAGAGVGIAVSQGVGEPGCVIGGTLVGMLGITVRDPTIVNSVAPDAYKQYDEAAILTLGEIFITAPAGGVVTGDPVWFSAGTGALAKATGGDNVGPVVGARWKFTQAAGALAIVQLGIQR